MITLALCISYKRSFGLEGGELSVGENRNIDLLTSEEEVSQHQNPNQVPNKDTAKQ